MRYLTVNECEQLGLKPYAVYGGKVYSLIDPNTKEHVGLIDHGSRRYELLIERADKLWQIGMVP